MKTYEDLVKFHKLLTDEITEFEIYDDFPKRFYQAFLSGDNTLYQKETSETRKFDEEWIHTLEQFFPSLDHILRNFKTELKAEREVVLIEKAKKTGSESIRHLASHPQYVKDITKDNVVPKNILSIQSEIEYQTYENRFIKTLIDRVLLFIDKRYDAVKNYVDTRLTRHFNLTSGFEVAETDVDMTLDIKIGEDVKDAEKSLYNRELMRRITHLAKLVTSFKDTFFYQQLKNAKPVIPPIMKTQVITKNVHYNRAYMLWIYLDRYNTLAFETESEEKDLLFDEKYLKNIYQTVLFAYSTVVANQKGLEYLYQYLDVKNATRKTPKVVKSHPDVTVDRDPMTFDDPTINQYFLDESKKVFEKSLEEHQKNAKTKDIALRRALRDTIEVTNNLYRSYFEFDTVLDDGFFRQFIKATPKEAFEDVKEKARIARIIRETKEVDYKNAIRLEKKFLQELSKREKDVIREESKSIQEKAQEETKELTRTLKASTHDEEQAMLAEHMAFVSQQNHEMLELHRSTNDKINEDLKAIKEKEELAIAQEKEKARIRFEREQARLKLKLEREKKRLKDKKAKAAQKERDRERARKAKARLQSKARVSKAKKSLETSNTAKLKKLQDKIDTLKGEGDGNT